jgi:hypothetical protein
VPRAATVPRTLAAAAVATLLGLSLWQLPNVFRSASRAVDSVANLTPEQRRLLPARAYDMATEIFVAAKQTIPEDESYALVTGPSVQVSSPLTLQKAPFFALFYLLPRRQTDVGHAQWLISYGGDLASLHVRTTRVVQVLPGLELARLAH